MILEIFPSLGAVLPVEGVETAKGSIDEWIHLLKSSKPLLLAVAIWTLVKYLKKIPQIPDFVLPFLAIIIGGFGYPALLQEWNVENLFLGLVIGGGAVGFHQARKQATEGTQIFRKFKEKKSSETSKC